MRSKNMCTSISPRIPSRYQDAANNYLRMNLAIFTTYSQKKSAIVYMLHVSLLQMTDMKTMHNQHTALNYKTVSKGSYINHYTSVAANEFSTSSPADSCINRALCGKSMKLGTQVYHPKT